MISIIVPVYNCEKYVEVCIESVVRQTYGDFELILINDGSTDNSGHICDYYAQNDTRVKVIHQINAGASAARNNGIQVASGKYITFLDSDDYWLCENILKQLLERLEKTNPDVLSFNFCKITNSVASDPYYSINRNMPLGISKEMSLDFIIKNKLWIASAWNKIVRNDLIKKNRLYFVEGTTAEDIGWCANLALVADRFDYADICVVGYVQRENSVTSTMTFKKVCYLKNNIDEVISCLNKSAEQKERLLNQFLAYQIGTLLVNVSLLEKSEWKNIINEVKQYMTYLKFTNNRKIRLIALVNHIVGFRITLFLLRIFYNTHV